MIKTPKWISALALGFVALTLADTALAAPKNVILITLDGVRYRDLFLGVQKSRRAGEERGTPIIPQISKIIYKNGFFVGNRPAGEPTMWISNSIALSQPGYRSILSGEFERVCRENDCPNIDHETIIDRLMDEGAAPKEVATFSSWDVIDKVIESKAPRAVRSIAFDPIKGLSPEEAAPFDAIQKSARADAPKLWGGSRFDRYTFEMGLQYLKSYRPRFLYLSFIEPDEYGHLNNYRGYVSSLRDFDARFAKLVAALKEMGEYGQETSIVVTTDHGRGRGFLWKAHSKEWIDSKRVWAIVLPSESLRKRRYIGRAERKKYFHVDVRPTIEDLLGLEPRPATEDRGTSLITYRAVPSAK